MFGTHVWKFNQGSPLFAKLCIASCFHVIRIARIILNAFLFILAWDYAMHAVQLYVANSRLSFIAGRETCDVTHAAAPEGWYYPRHKGTNYFRTNYFRKQLAPRNTIRTHKLSALIDNVVQNFGARNYRRHCRQLRNFTTALNGNTLFSAT